MQYIGAFTAIITPFKHGKVDEDALRRHIEWQIEQGIHGLVPCGTTGESATLTHEEHKAVIRICIDQVAKRVPVIAGAGSNNTQEAIHYTQYAKDTGADAALLITPYYNKPTQEGLYQHFKAITQAVNLPVILYNVPSRTGCNMLPATVARVAKDMPNIIGIKEATADLAQISNLLEQTPKSFYVLTGDDFTVLPTLALGGSGAISVTSNVAPAMMSNLCRAMQAGDLQEAKRLHFALEPINRAMFIETNPMPVKTALHYMGFCELEFRLPLVPLLPESTKALRDALIKAQLI